MAGYGTMKRHTTALNLGFPIAFEDTYATYGPPPAFEPEPHYNSTFDSVGDDFQAEYHEQKRRDAHYMANQKVVSTRAARERADVSKGGYYKMPKPVLGQRRYANPSYGANSHSHHSARQDQSGAPWTVHYTPVIFNKGGMSGMSGGVLRSSAGQRYGKQILNARIGQLNDIERGLTTFSAASAGLGDAPKTKFPGATGNEFNNELTSVSLVELAQLLQTVLDSTMGGAAGEGEASRFEFKDSIRAFALIVRAATDNAESDIANILEFIRGHSNADGIVPNLENLLEKNFSYYEQNEDGEYDVNDGNPELKRIFSLKVFWEQIGEYLKEMAAARHENRPKADIKALSRALIQKLGFTKAIKDFASSNLGNSGPIRPPPQFLDLGYNREEERNLYNRAGSSGAFINPSETREDSEHPGPKQNPKEQLAKAAKNNTVFASSSGTNLISPVGARGAAVQGIAAFSGINQSEQKIGETQGEKEAKNTAVEKALARGAVKAEEEAVEQDTGGGGGPEDPFYEMTRDQQIINGKMDALQDSYKRGEVKRAAALKKLLEVAITRFSLNYEAMEDPRGETINEDWRNYNLAFLRDSAAEWEDQYITNREEEQPQSQDEGEFKELPSTRLPPLPSSPPLLRPAPKEKEKKAFAYRTVDLQRLFRNMTEDQLKRWVENAKRKHPEYKQRILNLKGERSMNSFRSSVYKALRAAGLLDG
jgi:hypothetical protein